ncbi:hypothetical protein llg_22290 [Luteolibacter sp. LG18]|nr:hypothetical protein llg_22290 [Luteolibacter sp. LG18]
MGAAIGELLLGRKLGNRALAWGGLLGALPDLLDALLWMCSSEAWFVTLHRGISHSLLLIGIAAFALPLWLVRLWKKDKVERGRATAFVAVGLGAHVLLDCLTVEGAKLLAPFSDLPVALNCLFDPDLFITVPVLVTVLWLAFLKREIPKRPRKGSKAAAAKGLKLTAREKLAARGLAVAVIYMALAAGLKGWVSSGFDADLQRRQATFSRRMEAPTPYNILLWRSVVDRGTELWIGYKSVFESRETPVRWVVVPKGREYAAPFAEEAGVKAVSRFSDGWWVARPVAKGVWLADLRFGETRGWERKATVDLRPTVHWQWSKAEDKATLRKIQSGARNVPESLKRLVFRIFGNRTDWEGNPRLTGNPGSLPEVLEAVE